MKNAMLSLLFVATSSFASETATFVGQSKEVSVSTGPDNNVQYVVVCTYQLPGEFGQYIKLKLVQGLTKCPNTVQVRFS